MSALEIFIRLNAQSAGRDKEARLIQYVSRALWHQFQTMEINPVTVEKLKSVEYTLSTFRKLLRFGKGIDVLYAAFKTIHYTDVVIRTTVTMSKITSGLFLIADHILWIGRSGLVSVNTNKWTELSNRYWLYSITMNLLRDAYELKRIFDLEGPLVLKKFPNNIHRQLLFMLCKLFNDHKDVFWDTLRNGCDVWIPLTALGYTQFKPRTVGVLGTVSSIAGIVSLIQPCAKLTPG